MRSDPKQINVKTGLGNKGIYDPSKMYKPKTSQHHLQKTNSSIVNHKSIPIKNKIQSRTRQSGARPILPLVDDPELNWKGATPTGVKGGTPGQPNDGSQESIFQKKIGKYMSLNWLNKPIMRKDVVNNIQMKTAYIYYDQLRRFCVIGVDTKTRDKDTVQVQLCWPGVPY